MRLSGFEPVTFRFVDRVSRSLKSGAVAANDETKLSEQELRGTRKNARDLSLLIYLSLRDLSGCQAINVSKVNTLKEASLQVRIAQVSPVKLGRTHAALDRRKYGAFKVCPS